MMQKSVLIDRAQVEKLTSGPWPFVHHEAAKSESVDKKCKKVDVEGRAVGALSDLFYFLNK